MKRFFDLYYAGHEDIQSAFEAFGEAERISKQTGEVERYQKPMEELADIETGEGQVEVFDALEVHPVVMRDIFKRMVAEDGGDPSLEEDLEEMEIECEADEDYLRRYRTIFDEYSFLMEAKFKGGFGVGAPIAMGGFGVGAPIAISPQHFGTRPESELHNHQLRSDRSTNSVPRLPDSTA